MPLLPHVKTHEQFPPNRTVLSTFELPHICLMYPYLTSSPLTSAYNNAYPAPLVAVAYLQCLTRDMTVDALLNVDSADENAPARVMELCIEYIGHVWRTEWSRGIFGGALADTLSKELTDLDREVSAYQTSLTCRHSNWSETHTYEHSSNPSSSVSGSTWDSYRPPSSSLTFPPRTAGAHLAVKALRTHTTYLSHTPVDD